ncbi:MAG: hypothetical protein R3E51_16205 [Rhizobiaceae bacterium]
MVDRITPATTDRERQIPAREFGVEDGWPVFCEPFNAMGAGGRFSARPPSAETVGVQLVDDVSPSS